MKDRFELLFYSYVCVFLYLIKNSFGKIVQIFRRDNAKEYVAVKLHFYLKLYQKVSQKTSTVDKMILFGIFRSVLE